MAALQSQDVVLAIYLFVKDEPWTFQSLSDAMGISISQVHLAYGRLLNSKLVDHQFRKVIKRNLKEFLCHGVKYCFPPKEQGMGNGMVTGHMHPAVKEKLSSYNNTRFVWTASPGKKKGICVDPIHKAAINISTESKDAYAVLAIVDSIRLGRAREQEIAASMLEEIMK